MGSNRGFTIIELLIVMALSTIGLLGLMSMQSVAINGNSRSRSINEALALAQDKLEQYAHTPYTSLMPGTTVEPPAATPLLGPQGTPSPTGIYRRISTITFVGATATINVQVQFQSGQDASNHSVNVSTVRAN